ncbi:hydrogen peroxide-inducible genes activator [Kiloniella laminariae]|uniref:Hydrogen peroxide-inducible genes activator n=1 Tax=Kiloniella laminariae TaxID=454162 RepID=A0ABT4LN86_9PROT|nr:hydrogen peroxide-inducible genes activator [Kiloniella laminariae]MCZ4282581.1 hydrogen peroxide-inducible genes activator [Kiloniella laminariae]
MKQLPSLKQLQYLTALAETLHFAQAAERCNVTPSTFSAGIRDLENVLGVAVAERTKRTVFVTPIGLEIAERARRLLRDAEDVMKLASTQKEPMTGDMKLGAIPTVGPFILPKILPVIGERYPKLRLYLREEQTAVLLSRLRDGDLDVALIALPYSTENLTVRVLFDDAFQLACHAEHPLSGNETITDDDLINQPLFLLEEGHCLRSHALEACSLNNSPVRVQFDATSLQTLVQMVASGIGVTLLPQMAVDAGMSPTQDIRLIPLQRRTSRQIGLVWRASSPRVTEFELLAELFRNS